MREGQSVNKIEHLSLYFIQTAATLEHDGAVAQDLAEHLSWALTCIDVLKAAVIAQA